MDPLEPLENKPIDAEPWELPQNFSFAKMLPTPLKERPKAKYAQNEYVNMKMSKSVVRL